MVLYPEYPLRTERLIMRPFERGDVEAVFDYRKRDDVARYLFDQALSKDECALAIQQRIAQTKIQEEGDRVVVAVALAETGLLIGEMSLILRSASGRQGEIGWIFSPDYQGRGFATEAASCILDLAFGRADMHRVIARCDARNTGSYRLMERLGMRREAHFKEHAIFKGQWDEEFVYAVLAREWRERRQPA